MFLSFLVLVAGCPEMGSGPAGDSIQFLLPADGATVTEPEVLTVTGAGISRVTIEVDDEMVLDTTVQPFEWTLDPADYEGQRVVTVVAQKEGVDHTMSVTLNLRPGGGGGGGPVVFLAPAEGAVVDTPTSLAVQGGGVVSVDFRMDGARMRLDDTSPFSWVLNPAAVSEGNHQIVIEARLAGGGTQSRTVGVKTVAPEGEPAPPPEVVAAIQDLKPGEWYEIPNTRLDAVAADPSPGGTITGVIGAWSSGAYDTKRHRLIIWGGGHGDYAGNEIYAFSMSSFRWKRLNEPSAFTPGDPDNSGNAVQHPDGAPISRHTYDYIEYMPGVDRFFVGGGAGIWKGGQHMDSHTYLFNFDTMEWTTHDTCVANSIGATSALGPDGRVWQHGAFGDSSILTAFDGTTGKWTQYADYGAWIGYERTAEIDPIANKYVLIGAGDIRVWDLTKPNQQHVQPTTTGDVPPGMYAPGVAWDPETKKIVVWGGGSAVYALDTAALKWTAYATTGVNTTPPSQPGTGTNGRWRYVPSLKVFVVVNSTGGNVFVYKHS